jgi:hypothetical protein
MRQTVSYRAILDAMAVQQETQLAMRVLEIALMHLIVRVLLASTTIMSQLTVRLVTPLATPV